MPTTYAIPNGSTAFAATTYTGTGANQSISNAVNGTSFQPDFVWIKSRVNNPSGGTLNHVLTDVVRGVTKELNSNNTGAETTNSAGLTAFNSNGFSVGGDYNYNNPGNGGAMVGWQWKANGAAVTNTAGSITSQVSANTAAGFSVVTYTGNGSSATIGHGLGVAPSMYIVKRRDGASNWSTWHIGLSGGTYYVSLDSTAAQASNTVVFPGATPTSTVFSVGASICGNTNTYVAYCFAPVAGYSAFGSYTGNGSSDGPFVYLGFRPRWIMIKNITAASAGSWRIYDTSRATYNADGTLLWADLASAEVTDAAYQLDHVSNGFKIRNTSSDFNANSNTYIYAAFAENPLKYANAR
jgi:hypothetical protein